MDTLNTDDLFDASWLDDTMPDIPELAPEDAAMLERVVAYAVAQHKAKPKRVRKKEAPAASPSEKISIRIPRPLLGLLREQAALAGMPYQTFIKTMLHDQAVR